MVTTISFSKECWGILGYTSGERTWLPALAGGKRWGHERLGSFMQPRPHPGFFLKKEGSWVIWRFSLGLESLEYWFFILFVIENVTPRSRSVPFSKPDKSGETPVKYKVHMLKAFTFSHYTRHTIKKWISLDGLWKESLIILPWDVKVSNENSNLFYLFALKITGW